MRLGDSGLQGCNSLWKHFEFGHLKRVRSKSKFKFYGKLGHSSLKKCRADIYTFLKPQIS